MGSVPGVVHYELGWIGSYPMLVALWLLPLAGAVICWAFGPQLRERAGWLAAALVGASFVLTVLSWGDGTQAIYGAFGANQRLVTWIPGFDFGLLLDRLSMLWTLVITGVGFLIVFYSIGYMEGDRAYARFFAYMSFFVFAMLTLVLSDNFVGLLVGWGLVGLASYFLIGFWFERPAAVAAARKAFVINVVGDAGMMFAIFLIFGATHSIGFGDAFAAAGSLGEPLIFAICVALFVAAAAKSAQIPLHTWLPDAMEGPTPVSALIHAATMVTAGVYLIARCAPLWNQSPHAQMLVGTIGGLTALVGSDPRHRAMGYQTDPRVLDDVADRLHGDGRRRGRLRGRRGALLHARVLQGAAVPRLGTRDPRACQRAGHSQDGRAVEEDAVCVLGDADRRALDLRHTAV